MAAKDVDAKTNQTLKFLLVSPSRDFVLVAKDGRKVPVAELEGRLVGLYFSISSYNICAGFTPRLVDFYEKIKARGEDFEVVEVILDEDDDLNKKTKESFKSRPWFTLPIGDQTCVDLAKYFELAMIPSLAIIGQDGKTLHSNAAEAVDEHGVLAYPFTPDKFAELEAIEKTKPKPKKRWFGWV